MTRTLNKVFNKLLIVIAISGVFAIQGHAATLSPKLTAQIQGITDDTSVGVVIIGFNAPNGLTSGHLDVLRAVGISSGVTFNKLGMVGAVLTAGQIRALQNNPSVRSIWNNDRLQYYMNHARVMAGVDKVRTDAAMTLPLFQFESVTVSPSKSRYTTPAAEARLLS